MENGLFLSENKGCNSRVKSGGTLRLRLLPKGSQRRRGLQRPLCSLQHMAALACTNTRVLVCLLCPHSARPAPPCSVSAAVASASRSSTEDSGQAHFAEVATEDAAFTDPCPEHPPSPASSAQHLLPSCIEQSQPFLLVRNVLRSCSSVLFIAQ